MVLDLAISFLTRENRPPNAHTYTAGNTSQLFNLLDSALHTRICAQHLHIVRRQLFLRNRNDHIVRFLRDWDRT